MIKIAVIIEGGNIRSIVANYDNIKIIVIDNDNPDSERITDRRIDSVLTNRGFAEFLAKEAEAE